MSDIPKILFCTFSETCDVPNEIFENWKKLNPDWEIKFISNYDFDEKKDECLLFLKKHFEEKYSKLYRSIQLRSYKLDFWRVCLLMKYGGAYSDIDQIPLLSIDEMLNGNDMCVANESFSFMVCKPNHPFIIKVVNCFLNNGCTNWPPGMYMQQYKKYVSSKDNNEKITLLQHKMPSDEIKKDFFNKNIEIIKKETEDYDFIPDIENIWPLSCCLFLNDKPAIIMREIGYYIKIIKQREKQKLNVKNGRYRIKNDKNIKWNYIGDNFFSKM